MVTLFGAHKCSTDVARNMSCESVEGLVMWKKQGRL